MNTLERIQSVLNFERPDRLPIIEWASWWDLTVKRWESEGLPVGLGGVELQRYFGLDLLVQQWFAPRTADLPSAPSHGAPVLRDAAEYEAYRKAGWLHNLSTVSFDYFDQYAAERERGGAAFWFTLEGFFWFPRTLLGIEGHLYGFYDQPDLIHRMNQDQVDFCLQVLDRLFRRYRPEFMTFAEDLSYNHGPMLSKELFQEFLLPYYRQLVPVLKEHGVKVLIDSDGDITDCLYWFEEAGLEGILPLERQAGVDIATLRRDHPKALLVGAFDKTVMHRGEAALRGEFERLMPAVRTGGVMIGCDHQTPPSVSLADYRLYLKLFREYAAL